MSYQFPTQIEDDDCICGHSQSRHILGTGKCCTLITLSSQCACFKFRRADTEQQRHLEAERQINARLVEHHKKLAALDSIGPFTYYVQ